MGKKYLKPLHVNDLCPRGWAWVIGDCCCAPDEGDCNDCKEPLAPIMIDGDGATWMREVTA